MTSGMAFALRKRAATLGYLHQPHSDLDLYGSSTTRSSPVSSPVLGHHPTDSLEVSFVPPYETRKIGFFEQCWLWYSGQFAVSVLEPWEAIVLHVLLFLTLVLLYVGITRYLPSNIKFASERLHYYIAGYPTSSNLSL